MSHALVTIIAPLDLDRVTDAEAAVDKLGNPPRPHIRAALDKLEDGENGTHFASLHAFRSQDGKRGYIAFEFSADGTEDDALARIERQIGEQLRPVFMHASDWKDGGDLLAYLRRHRVVLGNGWFSNPGPNLRRHARTVGRPHPAGGQAWRGGDAAVVEAGR